MISKYIFLTEFNHKIKKEAMWFLYKYIYVTLHNYVVKLMSYFTYTNVFTLQNTISDHSIDFIL